MLFPVIERKVVLSTFFAMIRMILLMLKKIKLDQFHISLSYPFSYERREWNDPRISRPPGGGIEGDGYRQEVAMALSYHHRTRLLKTR